MTIGETRLGPINPRGDVALLYPPDYIAAIQAAGAAGDFERLDRITDDLVRMGYCRPRGDVAAERPAHGVLAAFTAAA